MKISNLDFKCVSMMYNLGVFREGVSASRCVFGPNIRAEWLKGLLPMMDQTKTALMSVIQMDRSITEEMRKSALAILSGSKAAVCPLVVSRSDAAKMLGLGPKRIDDFTRNGKLKRFRIPGSSRATGILCSSIEKLVADGTVD